MEVYIAGPVREISEFYGNLLDNIGGYPTIESHLAALASRMWEGASEGNEAVLREISNYHREHLGRPTEAIRKGGLSLDDCRHSIANEYGFRRWSEAAHETHPYEINFELAVNALLAGEQDTLGKLIRENPELLNGKSQYGHRATLLHYAVSNGVEMWRQRVPMNLPVLVKYLLESGINTKARMYVYGGEYTASELLLSSTHPREAGILGALQELLPS